MHMSLNFKFGYFIAIHLFIHIMPHNYGSLINNSHQLCVYMEYVINAKTNAFSGNVFDDFCGGIFCSFAALGFNRPKQRFRDNNFLFYDIRPPDYYKF